MKVAVDDESVATITDGVIARPEMPTVLAGLVRVTTLVVVQVKPVEPVYPGPSVAVTVTA